MPDQLTVLVTGATGTQGGAVARRLLERGHRVVATTRLPDSPAANAVRRAGAHVVAADFDDPAALQRVAAGADAAFVMATPFEMGPEVEIRQGTNVLEAARTAGVGHVVYSSVANADQQTGVPHFESKAELERRLARLGGNYTIVAPAFFMENVLAPSLLPGLEQGALALALPSERPLQQIAVANIADFVALVLDRPERFAGQRIDIASDELSGVEEARLLADATGWAIDYAQLPLEQMRAVSEDLALMFTWLSDVGYSVDIAALRRAYPEVYWLHFDEWANRRDWDRRGGGA